VEIKPTVTWKKDHPRYKNCPWPEYGCHCVITFADIDKNDTGLCVGVRLDAEDLDMVMMCTHMPHIEEGEVKGFETHAVTITPVEAGMFATQLTWAVSEIYLLDPAYRKEMGNMRRRRTRIIRRSNHGNDKTG